LTSNCDYITFRSSQSLEDELEDDEETWEQMAKRRKVERQKEVHYASI
jgi:hypothetical protein